MKTVALDALSRVMGMNKCSEMKKRGKLVAVKPAPHTEVLLSSIPLLYRRKLTDAR